MKRFAETQINSSKEKYFLKMENIAFLFKKNFEQVTNSVDNFVNRYVKLILILIFFLILNFFLILIFFFVK